MRLALVVLLAGFLPPGLVNASDSLVLRATGSKDTYRVINDQLAGWNGNVVEVPDCGHQAFGPHITQASDSILKKDVFRFHAHRDHDDDRCRKSDRQRTEIKVYAKSPYWLKAEQGSRFTYHWKFKLDRSFQGSRSFTHLHQIKAVGGSEASMPLITLSARKGRRGKSDQFELRYADHSKQRTIKSRTLKPFLGLWVEATETISYGENGQYSVTIKSVSTGEQIFSYQNNSIRMWKSGADFLRPKWGIYRSLKDKDNLRDEIVDFADFGISRQ
jgi:hypothetical protein